MLIAAVVVGFGFVWGGVLKREKRICGCVCVGKLVCVSVGWYVCVCVSVLGPGEEDHWGPSDLSVMVSLWSCQWVEIH